MYDSQIFAILHHRQLRDAVVPHLVQGIYHKSLLVNGFRVGGHDLRSLHMLNVGRVHQHSAKVAIGDDAQNLSILSYYGRTQAFVGHFDDDAGQVVVGSDFRAFIPDIQVFDPKIQLLAQSPTGMELRKIIGGEAATPH